MLATIAARSKCPAGIRPLRVSRSSSVPNFSILIAVAGAALGAFLITGSAGRPPPGLSSAALAAGSEAKFVYLVNQRSNRCDLQRSEVMSLGDRRRLQGACCTRMETVSYRQQVSGLRRYSGTAQVPPDPYDISAAQAKRLLVYDQNIGLGRRQQRTYQRAIALTSEHGPCCCQCWRWNAFRGLSKYLIARRGWDPIRTARVISLLDGCGGRAPS